MDNKTPTLNELNSLLIFSGRLSEVHVKNMQSFPFIFFNGVQEVKIDYDVAQTKTSPSHIRYDLTLNQENDHIEKRHKALENAIRALFWKEIGLKLFINGEEYKNV